ncbi:hypothetical protein AMET1_0153 [Methanonatronarchaeum thermophilum]|uniref:Uncharacterized protein n=1 Tax=Methanonatronarchaeum thermophilum TaxID=1927129 RepID=A0A1Y3GDD6_9EURY|nr:hypothetical protein [Methanonatronarchaeum thermophilum]OUJ19482.1 hypothetical protein AMET1_0153 [Methanonatronarchaeum thermophilum]
MSIVSVDEVEGTKEVLAGFLGLDVGDIIRKVDWYKDERPLKDWYEFEGWEYVPGDVPNKAWWGEPFCRVKVFRYNSDVMYVLQFSPGGSVVHGFSGTTDERPSSFEEKFDELPSLDVWVRRKIDEFEGYNILERLVGVGMPNYSFYLNKRVFESSLFDFIGLGRVVEGNPFLEVRFSSGVLFMGLVGEWVDGEWQLFVFEGDVDGLDSDVEFVSDLFFDGGLFGDGGFDRVVVDVERRVVWKFLEPVLSNERERLRDRIDRVVGLEDKLSLKPHHKN